MTHFGDRDIKSCVNCGLCPNISVQYAEVVNIKLPLTVISELKDWVSVWFLMSLRPAGPGGEVKG